MSVGFRRRTGRIESAKEIVAFASSRRLEKREGLVTPGVWLCSGETWCLFKQSIIESCWQPKHSSWSVTVQLVLWHWLQTLNACECFIRFKCRQYTRGCLAIYGGQMVTSRQIWRPTRWWCVSLVLTQCGKLCFAQEFWREQSLFLLYMWSKQYIGTFMLTTFWNRSWVQKRQYKCQITWKSYTFQRRLCAYQILV